jgi:hypothetical protein
MFKKIVVAMLVLALMVGIFAPLVQRASHDLAAEKPAVLETAWVAYPVDGILDPAASSRPTLNCVGWNS